MAAGATTRPQMWASRRGWTGTPEVYFTKAIDNSRLVKVADVKRSREMTHFACALAVFFLLVMVYAWQHFSAIEYGYRIEAMKSQLEQMRKDLEDVQEMARKQGFGSSVYDP